MSHGELGIIAAVRTGHFQRELQWAICLGVLLGALDIVWHLLFRTTGHVPIVDADVLISVASGYNAKPGEMQYPDPWNAGSGHSHANNTSDGASTPEVPDDGQSTVSKNVKDSSQVVNDLLYSSNSDSHAAGEDITSIGLEFSPGFKPHPSVYSDVYLRRGRPMNKTFQRELTKKWGSWTFVDPMATATPETPENSPFKSKDRPRNDYCASYPSRDVPRSQFPPHAWQTDQEFLSRFLPEAKALVRRAMEGILAEYGHGKDQEPALSHEQRSEMFIVRIVNDTVGDVYLQQENSAGDAGGYMNEKGYDGLVRRVLHAVMTEDTFRVVTAGHSAAAGHGNHFQQSYTLQIQRILEPIFARLGVTMSAHCLGIGSMGTLQNALGMRDLYGDDIDVLIYDSGITETQPDAWDMFMRQAIISGQKIPLLWANQVHRRFLKSDIFRYLGQECDAGVAVYGTGLRGIPQTTTSEEELAHIAWPAQFLKCDSLIKDLCREKQYRSRCWIERDDVTPLVQQRANLPEQSALYHPGYRAHQLQGRVFTFSILTAIDKALQLWSQADGYVLNDSVWHMDGYYSNIRSKLLALDRPTPCHKQSNFPARACDLSLHARSEYLPRMNPHSTSIRSIIKSGNLEDQVLPNFYDPPDVPNPDLDPVGLDLLSIVENGDEYSSLKGRRRRIVERQLHRAKVRASEGSMNPDIKPGLGWELDTYSAPDNCDGSYDSFCGRSRGSRCLLSGRNDHRGGLKFDSLSGWLILNLEKVQHGLILVKIEDWHSYDVGPTAGWTCVNNDCRRQDTLLRGNSAAVEVSEGESTASGNDAIHPAPKEQSPSTPEYCADFLFQFALDGNVTTWTLDEWRKRERKTDPRAQRANSVLLWTLLDDPAFVFPKSKAPRDVELAIRILGCQRRTSFKLTHVYWA